MNVPLLEREIRAAIGAHGAWKLQLSTAIAVGRSSISAEDADCHTCCTFGEWLDGTDIDAETRTGKPYQVAVRLHREFHSCAAEVLRRIDAGDQDGAKALFSGDYAAISEKLTRALTKWSGELKASA